MLLVKPDAPLLSSRKQSLLEPAALEFCDSLMKSLGKYCPVNGNPIAIVCHRGANQLAPENTLLSAEIAFRGGASVVEIDLHTSADGRLMVIHDEMANRTTDLKGAVRNLNSIQLKQCNASHWFDPACPKQSVSEFCDYLQLSAQHNKQLYVELKEAGVDQVMQQVKEYKAMSRCFFWSYNQSYIEQIAESYPEARLMKRRVDYSSLDQLITRGIPSIVEYSLEDVDQKEFSQCRDLGISVMICSLDSSEIVIRSVIEQQPDMVNIDDLFGFSEVYLEVMRNN